MKHVPTILLVLFVASAVALHLSGQLHFGAHPNGGTDTHGHGEEEEHVGESHIVDGKVVLEPKTAAAAGIATAAVARGSVTAGLTVAGEVQLAENHVAHVTPRIPGAIREVHRTLGDTVEADSPLCTVESVELGEARAAYVSALSERTLAERSFGRWKELFDKGLKTQNELWTAENALTKAQLTVDASMGKLRALGIPPEEIAELEKGGSHAITNRYQVKSPLAGSILEWHATLGENVDAKDKIFVVADLSEVWVQAAVHVKDLLAVRQGQRGTVKIQGLPSARFAGTVTYVGQTVSEKARTVSIRVAVKNEPLPGSSERHALRPGMFATVELETARKDDVVIVPLEAVQSVAGESVVFVQGAVSAAVERKDPAESAHKHDHDQEGKPMKNDEHGQQAKPEPGARDAEPGSLAFERRKVDLGQRDAVVAEVLKGLEPGELVVVRNAYLLKSEFERARISEGHSH